MVQGVWCMGMVHVWHGEWSLVYALCSVDGAKCTVHGEQYIMYGVR